MPLPPDFPFSQSSLQDFVDCPRRFRLRYLQKMAWPAIESEPVLENERWMQQGEAFHRLVQQYWSGIPAEMIGASVEDPQLGEWWNRFHQAEGLPELQGFNGQAFPELQVIGSLAGHRLVAKYDLVTVMAEAKVTIYDWKTSQRRTRSKHLQERLQTRLYPFLLVQSGAFLNQGQPLQAEQVGMVYWFAEHPAEPERFAYHKMQFEADQAYLTSLIEDIAGRDENEFPLTEDTRRCKYCVYRSHCERGEQAGVHSADESEWEAEEELILPTSLEEINEVYY